MPNLVAGLDINCPIKELSFKDHNNPWITKDILESIHKRNEYRSEYCSGHRHDPDLLKKAKQVRRDINAKTRASEDNYFRNKLNDLSDNPTKF